MKVTGVIIRITPYRETGGMFNVLTKNGLISFSAHQINKINHPNSTLNSPLQYGEFIFLDTNKTILSFKEFNPIIDSRLFLSDPASLGGINFLNETTLRLLNEEDMPKIYDSLIFLLEKLNKKKERDNLYKYYLGYLAEILKITGLTLTTDCCVKTREKENLIGLSLIDGGLVCEKAYIVGMHIPYSKEKIIALNAIFKDGLLALDKKQINVKICKEILQDLLIYVQDNLGYKLKSVNLLV